MAFNVRETIKQLTQPRGAEWFSIRYQNEQELWQGVRDGRPQYNNLVSSQGVMVEVFSDGAFGYSATNDLSMTSLQRALEEATRHATLAARHPVVRFPLDAVRPSLSGTYHSSVSTPHSARSKRESWDLLMTMTEEAKISEKVVTTEASMGLITSNTAYATTGGAEIEQTIVTTSIDLRVTAQEGSEVQSRSMNGFRGVFRQGGLELLDHALLLQRARITAQEALQLLSAVECPRERTSLVLSPDQMMLQIHESIGHPLELDRILGDERNYAGWSFVRPEDFGSLRYGTPLLNVLFEPNEEREFASYAFDDIGAQAEREYLIKDGILLRGIGGLESQYRSGLSGVASQRACSWNRPPIDRMANINIAPGQHSLEEILSGIERGVLMHTNRSWSIDDYRRKFQFGCELGYLIEEGRLTKMVKNPNYRGVSLDFWNSLTHVGDASTYEIYGTLNCGKGEPHQAIGVGHGSPVCAFKDIEVFGGAR